MKMALFSTKAYDKHFFENENKSYNHELIFYDVHLNKLTAPLAKGVPAVCAFVNDQLDKETLEILAEGGTRVIALRCAGFNNVDLHAAKAAGMTIVRVPAYSPHAVAEHAVALILALNRQIHRAHNRVREGNFALDGLLGFDLYGKTVGVIGTGRIGEVFAHIMQGFGCRVLAYDVFENPDLVSRGVKYANMDTVFAESDILSLHCPLTPETHHLITDETIKRMKHGVMIINTSRGALVNTYALIKHLKSGKVGSVALDVYEEEGDLFFEDLSNKVLQDDIFARLMTFPNVIVTGHQAFFTRNALEKIASTTLNNVAVLERGEKCENEVLPEGHLRK